MKWSLVLSTIGLLCLPPALRGGADPALSSPRVAATQPAAWSFVCSGSPDNDCTVITYGGGYVEDDELAATTNDDGTARTSQDYPFRYCQFGVPQEASWMYFGGDLTLNLQPVDDSIGHFVMLGEDRPLANWDYLYKLFSRPDGVLFCGGPLGWSGNTIDPSGGEAHLQDLPASRMVYLFRQLAIPTSLRGEFRQGALDPSNRKVIVLIHGWNPAEKLDPYRDGDGDEENRWPFIIDALKSPETRAMLQRKGWDVVLYNWALDAATGGDTSGWERPAAAAPGNKALSIYPSWNAAEASEVASVESWYLYKLLAEQTSGTITDVQIIAHSAGTWAARGLATRLMTNADSLLNAPARVQVTLLDAYVPAPNESLTSLDTPILGRLEDGRNTSTCYRLESFRAAAYNDDSTVGWIGGSLAAGLGKKFSWTDHPGSPAPGVQQEATPDHSPYRRHDGPLQWYGEKIADNASPWTKSIASRQPEPPGLVSPPEASHLASGQVTLQWSAPDGVPCDVYFGTGPGPLTLVASNTTARSLPVTVAAGTACRWSVVAKSDAGETSSNLFTFSAVPPPSSDPAIVLATLDSSQWEADVIPGNIFAAPAFGETGGLDIHVATDPTNTFGFWQTRNALDPPTSGTYMLTLTLANSSIQPGQRHPELRARVFRADNTFSSMALSAETSPNGGVPGQVEIFWQSDGVTPWRIAIDLLAFSPEQAGGTTITRIQNQLLAP